MTSAEKECRFLSDKRPAHAFYALKAPATIGRTGGSFHEQNPQVVIPYSARSGLFQYLLVAKNGVAKCSSMVTRQHAAASGGEIWKRRVRIAAVVRREMLMLKETEVGSESS
jgi:hypothetical protein